jgi:protein-disulfide isomerase
MNAGLAAAPGARYKAPAMRIAAAVFLAATAALAQEQAAGLTAEQAAQIVPRADLRALTDAQRRVFVDAATDLFVYAGCSDTLAKCLSRDKADPHALREAELLAHLSAEGLAASPIVQAMERYYDSFLPKNRAQLRSDNCPVLGKGPIALVEFSDYQCPHCAAALQPLDELVTKDRPGKVRLCSKYFPFSSHPRARIAALCAEFARAHGKFREMNRLLFEHQDALEDANLAAYAKELGLDGEAMLKKAYAGDFDAAVEKHIREGTAAGVEATPTLFIDGRVSVLPLRQFYLDFSIDDETAWKKDKVWNPPPPRKMAKRR